jgi:putative ABC transport system permease protein
MGVATIITVITLIQGANVYVEQKIANLGTNAFQIGRVPFAVTDFTLVLRALRNKYINLDDRAFVAAHCPLCKSVGAQANFSSRVRFANQELADSNIIGQTPEMGGIDTRTIELGRYFTETEDTRGAQVCLVGSRIREDLLGGGSPLGKVIRISNQEFTVIGLYERVGSVLGQDQDNFAVVPMGSFVKLRGSRFSVILHAQASGAGDVFEQAQDQARLAMRARRHIRPGQDEDFFIGTADSYIALWKSISSAFFAVFLMVSGISAVVGGIVIMNVMLVSVTERTKEIGVRRAIGATQADIRSQFLVESVVQCLIGGVIGIGAGFVTALFLRRVTSFPAAVEPWVATLGFALSSGIGLFFGIYPATRAAKLDPVVALRSE